MHALALAGLLIVSFPLLKGSGRICSWWSRCWSRRRAGLIPARWLRIASRMNEVDRRMNTHASTVTLPCS